MVLFYKKEDLLFWLEVMRDHAIFQNSTFSPKETQYIEKSMLFRDYFQSMINLVNNEESLNRLIPDINKAVDGFISFKINILRGLLRCNLEISLPPSLINHQIDEALEFRNELLSPESYQNVFRKPMSFISLLKVWLSDSSGHASAYASFLDPIESNLREEALSFKMKFDMLTIKADELQKMMMKSGEDERAFMLLVEETVELMRKFVLYLQKIKKYRAGCMVMAIGTLTPLLPDHMIREHEYFLNKLNEYLISNKC